MKNKKIGNKSDYVDFDFALNRATKLLKEDKNYKLAFLVILGINVGLRISDLRLIKFEDIESGTLNLIEKKTKKQRIIKVNENILTAFEILKSRCNIHEGYIFLSNSNTVYTSQYVNRAIKKIFNKSNLNISTHTLRKTFGRRVWDNNGQSDSALIFLSEIFNHASLATTRGYLGIRQEQLNEIYMNL